MPKRVFWKQLVVSESEVSPTLTALNFQPGKFQITALPHGNILIVYVDREIPNVK